MTRNSMAVMERFRYRGRMRLWGRETFKPLGDPGSSGSAEAVSDVLQLAAERIEEIVEAAERAAAEITAASEERLGSGEGEASSQITRERIVAQLSESLVTRASELRTEARALADVLGRASKRLSAATPASGAAADVTPTPTPTPTTPQPETELAESMPELSARVTERFSKSRDDAPVVSSDKRVPFKRRVRAERPPKAEGKRPSNDGLRLLATQMAVAGSTQEEIASRLRDEFGVEDATALMGESPIARKVKESETSG